MPRDLCWERGGRRGGGGVRGIKSGRKSENERTIWNQFGKCEANLVMGNSQILRQIPFSFCNSSSERRGAPPRRNGKLKPAADNNFLFLDAFYFLSHKQEDILVLHVRPLHVTGPRALLRLFESFIFPSTSPRAAPLRFYFNHTNTLPKILISRLKLV